MSDKYSEWLALIQTGALFELHNCNCTRQMMLRCLGMAMRVNDNCIANSPLDRAEQADQFIDWMIHNKDCPDWLKWRCGA